MRTSSRLRPPSPNAFRRRRAGIQIRETLAEQRTWSATARAQEELLDQQVAGDDAAI